MAKIRRNDPCPCGSGKKYKQCCMQKRKSSGLHARRASVLTGGLSNVAQATQGAASLHTLSSRIKPLQKKPEPAEEQAVQEPEGPDLMMRTFGKAIQGKDKDEE